jgi:L-ascorbate metabolism protein UlaG (beta-lactamase superfamily)
MPQESLYLKPDVQIEPLFYNWYAWPYLIPPATASRNLVERCLKYMDSYINAPQAHATALKNPKMLGGPFLDLGGKHVDEVRRLREETKRQAANLIELSIAIDELDRMLRDRAKGYSLSTLYPMIPPALRGYVELVYDLANTPSFRVIEQLLYKSKFYDTSAQSLMLSPNSRDDRPFILSTPRLEGPEVIHVRTAFDSVVFDQLALSRFKPVNMTVLLDSVPLPSSSRTAFRNCFTTAKPRPGGRYTGNGVRWRYFGHACVLLETARTSILFDPAISYEYPSDCPRYTFNDLPEQIDYVVHTHGHHDHVVLESLLQLKPLIKNIVVPKGGSGSLSDPSLKLLLQRLGFKSVVELDEMESLDVGDFQLTALPFFGEHGDLNIRSRLAYFVRTPRQRFLFAADSCNIEPTLYEHVRSELGDADVLFIGMECDGAPMSTLYGPLATKRMERGMDESRRFAGSDFSQAMNIVEHFNCEEVYVYAMGQEPWLTHIMSLKYTNESRPIVESNLLVEECIRRGKYSERLYGQKEVCRG